MADTSPLTKALTDADAKASTDEAKFLLRSARPKPVELQAELTGEARQEIATEKYLLDGFFKAKLQNADSELDLTDVQMIRNLQAVARHMCERSKTRR